MGEINITIIMKTALLAGPTGLIGNQLLHLLLQDDEYSRVKAISRRPLNMEHPKLENLVLDFDTMTEHYEQLKADDVFCCLGTTMRQAGSKEAFKKVDYSYPVELAKIAKGHGALRYLLVSALGANKNSAIYYNRIKGEVEEAVAQVGFSSLHIFRPSLLVGDRKEVRAGEGAAKIFYKIFGALIPNKYKAIDSLKVAKAMLHFSKEQQQGNSIHESDKLHEF